jgi:hypothetical protein
MSHIDDDHFHVRIPLHLRPALERIAEREYMNVAQVARKLLDRALRQHETADEQVSA